MDNDSMNLLNDEFDYLIDELSENGQIKESVAIEEDNDLVNFVGNVVGEVETIERENKMEQPLKQLISQLHQKIMREIRFTLITQLMEIWEIVQRILSKVTL